MHIVGSIQVLSTGSLYTQEKIERSCSWQKQCFVQAVHRAGHLARCTLWLIWQEAHIWGAAEPQTHFHSIPVGSQELTALSPSQSQEQCPAPWGFQTALRSALGSNGKMLLLPHWCSPQGASTLALGWAQGFQLHLGITWRLLFTQLQGHLHSQLPQNVSHAIVVACQLAWEQKSCILGVPDPAHPTWWLSVETGKHGLSKWHRQPEVQVVWLAVSQFTVTKADWELGTRSLEAPMLGTVQEPMADIHAGFRCTTESISQVWALPTDLMRRGLVKELVLTWLHFDGKKSYYSYKVSLTVACWWCTWKEGAKRGRGWEHKSKPLSLSYSRDVAIWQTMGCKCSWWRVWIALQWPNGISDPSIGQRQCQGKRNLENRNQQLEAACCIFFHMRVESVSPSGQHIHYRYLTFAFFLFHTTTLLWSHRPSQLLPAEHADTGTFAGEPEWENCVHKAKVSNQCCIQRDTPNKLTHSRKRQSPEKPKADHQ